MCVRVGGCLFRAGVEVWEEDYKILGEGFLHILFYI